MAKDYQSIVIQLMRDLDLKQKEFAQRVGVTQPTVSRWLKGAYPEPDQAECIDALWNDLYGQTGSGVAVANAPTAPTSSLGNRPIGKTSNQELEEKRLQRIAAGIFRVAAEYCERSIPESLIPHLGEWALGIVLGNEALPLHQGAAPREKPPTESEGHTSSKTEPSSREEH